MRTFSFSATVGGRTLYAYIKTHRTAHSGFRADSAAWDVITAAMASMGVANPKLLTLESYNDHRK